MITDTLSVTSFHSAFISLPLSSLQAMLTLLEVQDFELANLRATLSPTSKRKLALLANPPAPRWPKFSPEEIRKNREEIMKLSDRIALLEKHCEDSITQVSPPHTHIVTLHMLTPHILTTSHVHNLRTLLQACTGCSLNVCFHEIFSCSIFPSSLPPSLPLSLPLSSSSPTLHLSLSPSYPPSLPPSFPPSLPPSLISQIEEVMEFVLLFEDDLKVLNKFLSISKERLQLSREMGGQRLEEAWKMMTEVRG